MLASFCRISDDNIRECINYILEDYVDVYMLHTFTDCHNFFNFHLDIVFFVQSPETNIFFIFRGFFARNDPRGRNMLLDNRYMK